MFIITNNNPVNMCNEFPNKTAVIYSYLGHVIFNITCKKAQNLKNACLSAIIWIFILLDVFSIYYEIGIRFYKIWNKVMIFKLNADVTQAIQIIDENWIKETVWCILTKTDLIIFTSSSVFLYYL